MSISRSVVDVCVNAYCLVVARGYSFVVNHLRLKEVSCYWKTLLKKIARLQQWKPTRNPQFKEIVAKD